MKTRTISVLLGLTSLFVLAQPCLAQDSWLDKYLWKNRIVVIYPGAERHKPRLQQVLLQRQVEGLRERDVVVVQPKSRKQREDLGLSGREFTVLLIGKDGSVKLRSKDPVKATEFFELIDSMPMRRREMRDR